MDNGEPREEKVKHVSLTRAVWKTITLEGYALRHPLAGLFDTGFDGTAVCGKKFLERYMNLWRRQHGEHSGIEQIITSKTIYKFGLGEASCMSTWTVPFILMGEHKFMTVDVVPGNLSLVLGLEWMSEVDIYMRARTREAWVNRGARTVRLDTRKDSAGIFLVLHPDEPGDLLMKKTQQASTEVEEYANILSGQADEQDGEDTLSDQEACTDPLELKKTWESMQGETVNGDETRAQRSRARQVRRQFLEHYD